MGRKKKSADKPEYFVSYSFSYTPTHGENKGLRVRVSPGEEVPGEVIDNEELLDNLLRAGKVLQRGSNGEVKYDDRAVKLSAGQIEALTSKGGDINSIKNLLQTQTVERDSLIRLQASAERYMLPQDIIQMIEAVTTL
jgi:hypothetical protein